MFVAEFRYLHKLTLHLQDVVGHERRMWPKYVLAVLYHFMTSLGVRTDFCDAAFPHLASFWKRIEVPRAFYTELPPIFTYKAEDCPDDISDWWVAAYTEFTARTLAFLLFEAYEYLRLWKVSRDTFRLVRDLNL